MNTPLSRSSPLALGTICLFMSLLFCGICMLAGLVGKADTLSASAEAAPKMPHVVIDPGHGGEDGGCSSADGIVEKELNLSLSLMLADILRMSGAEVTLTRSEDILLYDRNADYVGHKKQLDLKARLDIARSDPEAIFISIHMNSFPEAKWHGLQVWYSKNSPESSTLAESIRRLTQEQLQPDNTRRIKAAGSNIYLLDRATAPAVLVECGFLSNPDEAAELARLEYQKKLALIIAQAVWEQDDFQ